MRQSSRETTEEFSLKLPEAFEHVQTQIAGGDGPIGEKTIKPVNCCSDRRKCEESHEDDSPPGTRYQFLELRECALRWTDKSESKVKVN